MWRNRAAAGAGGEAATNGPVRVVVADLEPWDCLLQLGAVLRRRGVEVEHWCPPPRGPQEAALRALHRVVLPRRAHVVRWAGGRSAVDVSAAATAAAAAAAAGRAPLVVEAVDRVAAALSALGEDHLPRRLAPGHEEAVLYDKYAMGQAARRLGTPVPEAWSAVHEAAGHLPVVVKARLGSGGQDVVVAPDAERLAAAWGPLSAAEGGAFAEQLLPGELCHVAGVARRGEVLAVAAYRSVADVAHGPSTSIELIDDGGLSGVAAPLVAAGGYTGAFCLDLVRDAAGHPRVVDVNARIFGSFMAVQAAGVDLLGAYWRAYDLPGRPPGPPAGAVRWGVPVPVRPSSVDGLASGARLLATYRPWLGWRWCAVTSVEWAVRVLLRRFRSARRPGPAVDAPEAQE